MASTVSDMARSPKVGIVVLNYHGTSDTLKCLDSLQVVNPETSFTIVVDNASTPDPTSQVTQAHPWTTVIRRDDNGGWAGGNNTGIRHALEHGADWVLLLNNDTTVAPGFVDRLLAAARHASRLRHPRPGHLLHGRARNRDDGWVPVQPPRIARFLRAERVPIEASDPSR